MEKLLVICKNSVFDEYGRYLDVYKLNKIYNAYPMFDRCLIEDNNYIEYDWVVFCSEHNHYQFTDSDFHKYFTDLQKERDIKIHNIISEN